ncbi:MAG: YicC family protein [Desulfobulbus propionicus]|nr:MAG: YicC family protein [Desulfobulbus propionicus]
MRPRSMTGFGRGESKDQEKTWTVEVRTVNHRFLDQRVNLPRNFNILEDRIKKEVTARLDRGRVEITCTVSGQETAGTRLVLNEELAQQYHGCLRQLGQLCDLEQRPALAELLTCRDLIVHEEEVADVDAAWLLIEEALIRALDDCDRMRAEEGAALKGELLHRISGFTAMVEHVEKRVPEILIQRQNELGRRIEKLLSGVDLDPLRLAQESAIMADKADVTEELVRLRSHLLQFRRYLDQDQPVGRRLDFLLQEFLREVNTLASKISAPDIAHVCVELKNEIEKLREQVQNLE